MSILKHNIKIQEIQVWMDGGSVTINCSNSKGQEYIIEFQQHMILKTSSEGKMPGRIYLNNKLVNERSDVEKQILFILNKAIIKREDKLIIDEMINYVQSEEYEKNNKIIEKQRTQLIGCEFDWFALDCNGNYGIFSSAGSGVIPMNVIEDYKNHKAITDLMVFPNYGSELIWNDLANYGFYVYDWELNNGPYVKKSKPNSKITEKMCSDLSKLRSLIKLKVSFKDMKEIIID